MNKKKKLRVLAVGGSGVRGIVAARILQELEQRTGQHTSELFDLVVGSSAGALVALSLMTPTDYRDPRNTAKDMVKFYLNEAPFIYRKSDFHCLKMFWGLTRPKYDREHLDEMLLQHMGKTKLSETLKPVAIATYSLNKAMPHLWTTDRAEEGVHRDLLVRHLAAAANAMPTYFSPTAIKYGYEHLEYEVDAGPWVNQPAMMALPILKEMGTYFPNPDITLVALGTQRVPLSKRLNWFNPLKAGINKWVGSANLIDTMAGSDGEWSQDAIDVIYPNNYYFQVPVFSPYVSGKSMDDGREKHLSYLLKATDDYIEQHTGTIKQLCKTLLVQY